MSHTPSQQTEISVIIPVRNASGVVGMCIKTLQRQTKQELEFIFVDDASTDSTCRIIRKAALRDSRITLLQQEQHEGPGAARNKGIDAAQGKYIGFLDADDSISPSFYEHLFTKATTHDYWVVKGTCTKVQYNQEKCSTLNERIRAGLKNGEHLLNLFNYEHWTAIYQRDFINRIGARNGNCYQGEDNIFLMQVMCNLPADRFTTEDAAHYLYQVNETSVSEQFDLDFLEQSYLSLLKRLEFMETQPDSPAARKFVADQFEEKIYHRLKRVWGTLNLTKADLQKYLDSCFELMSTWVSRHPDQHLGEYSQLALSEAHPARAILNTLENAPSMQGRLQMLENEVEQLHRDIALLLNEKKIQRNCWRYKLCSLFSTSKKARYLVKLIRHLSYLRRIAYIKTTHKNTYY